VVVGVRVGSRVGVGGVGLKTLNCELSVTLQLVKA